MVGYYTCTANSTAYDDTTANSYNIYTDNGTSSTAGAITTSSGFAWNNTDTYYTYVYIVPVSVKESKQDKRARLQREEQHRLEQEQLRREQEAAVKRAEELLKEHIGTRAFGKLHKAGYIELDSQKHKGHKYRVPNNTDMIEVLDSQGKVVDRLCVHPSISCPVADQILTRLVLLESAEDFILETANHHGGR